MMEYTKLNYHNRINSTTLDEHRLLKSMSLIEQEVSNFTLNI